jgi:L-serine/L-threonine ammonia-lyase
MMMQPLYTQTPLWHSVPLSAAAGVPILLKMEALQPVGSFKARGMGAACQASHAAGVMRVVCSSGGNAGYAVAYASRQLGMQATIVVPETTLPRSRQLIQQEGATLIVHGKVWDDAHAYGLELAAEQGADYIHPFDDPIIWHGHASMVAEIAEAGVKPGLMVVSVGGGGLLCGLLEGMHAAGWVDVPVLAVETEGAASFAASIQAGQLVTLPAITSIATTLGARRVTHRALEWSGRHPIHPWTVTDRQALDACLRFADDHRLLVEPACGAALSAAYQPSDFLDGKGPVVIIVCGGAGVNRLQLEEWDRNLV